MAKRIVIINGMEPTYRVQNFFHETQAEVISMDQEILNNHVFFTALIEVDPIVFERYEW